MSAVAQANPSGHVRSPGTESQSAVITAAVSLLDTSCRVSLWITIFAVPLMMAGVREGGVAVFIGCSLVMTVSWAAKQLLRPETGSAYTSAVLVLLAALSLVGLQITELPAGLVRVLSPFNAAYLSAWDSDVQSIHGSGAWSTISLTPSLTRSAFALAIAYAAFFLTLLQRLRTSADIENMLRLVAAATVVMAVIALGQMFFGNGEFLWIIRHPFRNASWPAKGTFTNQNHFAHFVTLGIGPLVWWWKSAGPNDGADTIKGRVTNQGFGVSRNTHSHQKIVGGAFAVVILAGILSLSRGGVACLLIAATVCLITLGREWLAALRLAVPAVAFLAISIFLVGSEALEDRWNRIAEAESLQELSQGRFLLWAALVKATPYFWPAGAGVGAHAEVYPTWLEHDPGKRLSHAESGYMQILIETGLPGLLLVVAAFALCTYWFIGCWKRTVPDERLRLVAIGTGIAVSALHSTVDFVWYIPACLIFTLILAACLCRSRQLTVPRSEREATRWPTRWALIALLLAAPVTHSLASATIAPAQTESAWSSYREHAVTASSRHDYQSTAGIDERLDLMIGHLEDCVRHDAANGAAKSKLAVLYLMRCEKNLKLSDNPMTVGEIRNTVESSEFDNPGEIFAWLKRAFGADILDLYRSLAMARAGLQLQPLRGQTYMCLARVGFLAQASADQEALLVDQAVRLRPYSAGILFSKGRRFAEVGKIDEACTWWTQAIQRDEKMRQAVIHALTPVMQATELIDRLELDLAGTLELFNKYKTNGDIGAQEVTARRFVQLFHGSDTVPESSDSVFWRAAHDVFAFVGEPRKAIQCLARAAKGSPDDYYTRKRLGLSLYGIGANDAANKQLQWCRLRNPDDQDIGEALAALNSEHGPEVTHGPQ